MRFVTRFPAALPAWTVAVVCLALSGCTKDEARGTSATGAPPPTPIGSPPPPVASASAVAGCGTSDVKDPISAPFFPRRIAGHCADPDVKTYGDKAQFTVDQICNTALDGGCEIYKDYGRKRLVSGRYVDDAGKGVTVETALWQFTDTHGALGMFTRGVLGDQDPAEKTTPRVITAGGAAALGTGRAYMWKGEYLLELTYNNERESPEALKKSSDAILPQVAKAIADQLPAAPSTPYGFAALPLANQFANGVLYFPQALKQNPLGLTNVGPIAMGFYKDGERRYRMLAIAKDDVDQAKDAFKAFKARPGSQHVAAPGDDAVHVTIGGSKETPKIEWLIVRKGNVVLGVGDEEFALRSLGAKADAARLTKDEALKKMEAWTAQVSATGKPAASASASAASSAPKK